MSYKSKSSKSSRFHSNTDLSEIHFFLWCSHGGTVSSEFNLYNVETGVNCVMFYGNHYDKIGHNLLQHAMAYNPITKLPTYQNFDTILNGCSTLSQQLTDENGVSRLNTLLPTLIFHTMPTDSYNWLDEKAKITYQDFMGLHYFKIVIENGQYVIKLSEKIMNWGDIANKSVVTYSLIFNTIKKHCKDKNIPQHEATTGIYACSSFIDKYQGDYTAINLKHFIPRIADTKHRPIYLESSLNNINANLCISPCVFPANYQSVFQTWEALARITHQGCALNVLSFFSIISQARAREEATCLNIKGTSIVDICKYINNFLIQQFNLQHQFIILRFGFNKGIEYIINFLSKSELTEVAVCVKFYTKLYHPEKGTNKFSNMGHTVAFGVYEDLLKTKVIYYIDPQVGKNYIIAQIQSFKDATLEENISTFISKFEIEYPNDPYSHMDIIFIIKDKSDFKNRECLTSAELKTMISEQNISIPNNNNTDIIGVTKQHLAGGNSTRTRTSRNTSKSQLSKTRKSILKNPIKASKASKPVKTFRTSRTPITSRVSRTTPLPETDLFQLMVQKIDKSNKVKSIKLMHN